MFILSPYTKIAKKDRGRSQQSPHGHIAYTPREEPTDHGARTYFHRHPRKRGSQRDMRCGQPCREVCNLLQRLRRSPSIHKCMAAMSYSCSVDRRHIDAVQSTPD